MSAAVYTLRERARRYRELAGMAENPRAERLRMAAEGLDHQADALDAYQAADRLAKPHLLAMSA